MDLNELLHAHQVAVMKAGASDDTSGRDNHFAKVAEYADRVRQLRETHQMSTPHKPADAPATIIYGTYAGEAAEPHGEGGAIDGPADPDLPEGVTSRLVREYRVGAFVYQDLGLALAEHLRQMSAAPDGPDAVPDSDLAGDA